MTGIEPELLRHINRVLQLAVVPFLRRDLNLNGVRYVIVVKIQTVCEAHLDAQCFGRQRAQRVELRRGRA